MRWMRRRVNCMTRRAASMYFRESQREGEEQEIARSSEEMIAMYEELVQQFPIVSILRTDCSKMTGKDGRN